MLFCELGSSPRFKLKPPWLYPLAILKKIFLSLSKILLMDILPPEILSEGLNDSPKESEYFDSEFSQRAPNVNLVDSLIR